jgi:hypothetical protein
MPIPPVGLHQPGPKNPPPILSGGSFNHCIKDEP